MRRFLYREEGRRTHTRTPRTPAITRATSRSASSSPSTSPTSSGTRGDGIEKTGGNEGLQLLPPPHSPPAALQRSQSRHHVRFWWRFKLLFFFWDQSCRWSGAILKSMSIRKWTQISEGGALIANWVYFCSRSYSENRKTKWECKDIEIQRHVLRSIAAFLDGVTRETRHDPLVKVSIETMYTQTRVAHVCISWQSAWQSHGRDAHNLLSQNISCLN